MTTSQEIARLKKDKQEILELFERGYDLSTLKFSIQKLKKE